MREILFRGKMPVESKWAYGSLISEANIFDKMLVLTHIYDKDCNEILVDPKTVGQYTGLCDKNGTRIFEGDIVKVGNALVRGIFAVEYSGMGACFIVSCGESRYFLGGCSSEVIGNIHDNPDLLEENKWN